MNQFCGFPWYFSLHLRAKQSILCMKLVFIHYFGGTAILSGVQSLLICSSIHHLLSDGILLEK